MKARDLYLELLKKQVIAYAAKSALKKSAGWQVTILTHVIEYIFDKWMAPVIKWAANEAIIKIDVWQVKRELMDYEDADTREERLRRFDALS